MIRLANILLVLAIGLACTAIAIGAHASERLDRYAAAWQAGTLYPFDETYADFFARTDSRTLTIEAGPATETRDLATYQALYDLDGVPAAHGGIMMVDYDPATGEPLRTRTWPLRRHTLDLAAAGQGADWLTTAGGTLLLGASEVNPLFGPIFEQSPVLGLAIMGGAKWWLVHRADSAGDYLVCVDGRTSASRMGFAFGAHNVAGLSVALLGAGSAAMPVGLLAGICAWALSKSAATEDAAVRCFEAQEARK